MKVALIKEQTDPFGPWGTMAYPHDDPGRLLDRWPFKSVYFELTLLLEADWYVIPLQDDRSWFARNAALGGEGRRAIFDRHVTDIVKPEDIPFDRYDVVICFNPILRPPAGTRPLFAYFLHEHVDPLYVRSLGKVTEGYDLFLDHLLYASPHLRGLPQSVGFPYLRSPGPLRRIAGEAKEDRVWMDAKTVMEMACGESLWDARCDRAVDEIAGKAGMPVHVRRDLYRRFWGIDDPPRWNDARDYFRELARCRYVVSVATGGAGQTLADAASLGAVCLGSRRLAYHRLIVHPSCLCRDAGDALRRIRELAAAPAMREEILRHQEAALSIHFDSRPRQLLRDAADLKARGVTSGSGNWAGLRARWSFRVGEWRRKIAHRLRRP